VSAPHVSILGCGGSEQALEGASTLELTPILIPTPFPAAYRTYYGLLSSTEFFLLFQPHFNPVSRPSWSSQSASRHGPRSTIIPSPRLELLGPIHTGPGRWLHSRQQTQGLTLTPTQKERKTHFSEIYQVTLHTPRTNFLQTFDLLSHLCSPL
jgi:hypothetical protein